MNKILIPQHIDKKGLSLLEQAGYQSIYLDRDMTHDEILHWVPDCCAIITRLAKITPDIIDAGKGLKIIAKIGVGVDNIDVSYATKKQIHVTNTPYANINAVAESVIMYLLLLSKDYNCINTEFKKGDFTIKDSRQEAFELKGRTLGLIGFGKIAQLVAKKAYYGFDMKILAYSPSLVQKNCPDYVTCSSKESILKQSDFVSIHIPSNEKTRKSIGIEDFREMKETACLINTARGNIIVEDELIQALKEHMIKGAGIDVYDPEPPVKDHPFLSMNNVIATPHSCAQTIEAREQVSIDAAHEIISVLSGKAPMWSVNKL